MKRLSPLKRLWPGSLRGQMLLLLLAALFAAQALTFVIFAEQRWQAIIAANRGQVISRTLTVVRLLEALPPTEHAAIVAATSTRGFKVSLDGESAVEASPPGGRAGAIEARLKDLLGREGAMDVRVEAGEPFFGHHDEAGEGHHDEAGKKYRDEAHEGPLSLLVAVELGPRRWLNLEHRLPPPQGGWFGPAATYLGLTVLLLACATWVIARRITRPLAALASAADRLGRGEDVPPLSERGPLELRRTAHAFNRMQERLHRYVRDRTRMLAAIAHDLRTPITALRLRSEMLDDEEERGRFVASLDEMQALVESGLAFAREESEAEPVRPVDLQALAESVADDLVELGGAVAVAAGSPCVVRARPQALKRALRNVVENALRYGAWADLSIERGAESVRLVVEDDGPGIPEGEIERAFEPFVRLEASRSRETGGIGLGLAIARGVMRGHGGDVVLTNREEGGLRAVLVLPQA
ncbi:MAG: HAMP domain-containing protein [Geminicoccaceae bacterium]|nr:HAMP domain-containing protein [Geminicoccaceae bacterium]